jgi:hypothetical protein
MILHKMSAWSVKCLLSALFGQNGADPFRPNVETILETHVDIVHKVDFLISRREQKISDVSGQSLTSGETMR